MTFTIFILMKLNFDWNHSLLPYLICEKFLLADKRKCYCNFLPNLNFIKKVSRRNAATQIQDHDRSRNWFRQRKSNDDDIMISLHRLLLYVFMMIVKIFLVQKCSSYNMKSNALGSNFLLSWISKQSIEGRSQNLVYDVWISHFGFKKKLKCRSCIIGWLKIKRSLWICVEYYDTLFWMDRNVLVISKQYYMAM